MPSKLVSEDCLILELRAGVGGHEANLFTEQLLKMYYRLATKRHWQFKLLNLVRLSAGGIREAMVEVAGNNVTSILAWEAGVHRVQRIPRTETKGRIHTSTTTIAILPPSQLPIPTITSKDLKIETMRSTGAGGQHINTTDSAVRITHLPTGISTTSSHRSQHHNKTNALNLLQHKLTQHTTTAISTTLSHYRINQITNASRTAKIKTYNFIHDKVIDHRLGTSVRGVAKVLSGNFFCL